MNKPCLIVVEKRYHSGWDSLTWNQRQGYRDEQGRITKPGMTAADLITMMGPLYVKHPDFKGSPPVISVVHWHKNLVGRHGTSSFPVYKQSLLGSVKTLLAWVLR